MPVLPFCQAVPPQPCHAELVRTVPVVGCCGAALDSPACFGGCRALGAGHDLRNFDIDNAYGSAALKRVLEDICGETLPMEGVKVRAASPPYGAFRVWGEQRFWKAWSNPSPTSQLWASRCKGTVVRSKPV